jgi:hypothetical protein
MKKIIFLVSSVMLFAQCGSSETVPETSESKEVKEEVGAGVIMYSVKEGSTEVKWTAFKLTDKIGVNGKFDSVNVQMDSPQDTSILGLMSGAKMTISTASTSTGDADRDGKIKAQFFGTMADGGGAIFGTITEVSGEIAGTANVLITMNNSEVNQIFNWKYDNGMVIMTATLDVNNWSANKSLGALNTVCNELHKGPDGKSVLWPDVEVVVNFRVIETYISL